MYYYVLKYVLNYVLFHIMKKVFRDLFVASLMIEALRKPPWCTG